MLRKCLFWGLAVVLVCMLIVGCGEGPKAPPEGPVITLSQGWKIHYLDKGPKEGPVVLFVHGLGGSSEYWKQTLACTEMEKYRFLAIDMLGFGSSDKPKSFDYSIEKQAETIQEFLALKNVNKVIYVGHSMAGAVGNALLGQQAGMIKKLVLVDSTLSEDYLSSKILKRMAGWAEWKFRLIFPLLKVFAKKLTSDFFEARTPETIEMAARAMKQSTYYSFHRSLKCLHLYLAEHPFLKSFKGLTIPHYYIFGTNDEGVARMVKDHFKAEPWVYSIEKAKHCPMVEAPERFCFVLAKILAE